MTDKPSVCLICKTLLHEYQTCNPHERPFWQFRIETHLISNACLYRHIKSKLLQPIMYRERPIWDG